MSGDNGSGLEERRVRLTPEEINRYSRHLTLPEVGLAGQERIKAARVLCIGSGGLGSPIGIYLAAAGVGTLGVVDFDVVDVTNLQRQIAHTTRDVGRPKVQSIREKIEAINPHVQVEVHETRLTRDNALEIFAPYDLIIDGSDNFETRYLVNDAAYLAGKPLIYGSIFRFEGQIAVFDPHHGGPCYRCLYSSAPPASLVPS
jgi:adenylyltransferase/sulfurtransferase